MRQFEARIMANRAVAESWREIELEWKGGERPLPGQFFTLRASGLRDPLLRRPLAFSGRSDAGISAIYQVRGDATRLLARIPSGSTLDVIGPLGLPFPPIRAGERALLAGGGIGLGPLLFLAREIERDSGEAPLAILGFRNAASIPALALPAGAVLCTDDGSAGFRGTPVEWIARNAPSGGARICGCGPAGMLAALAALTRERGWSASLSAEQWMACGVGACMGCALPRPGGGYLRACADGPVFELGDIDWAALASRAAPAPAPAPAQAPSPLPPPGAAAAENGEAMR